MMQHGVVNSYLTAVGRWYNTLVMLMVINFGFRFRSYRLAPLLSIAEPLGVIALMSLTHVLALRHPPFGTSYILFYGTGILPFYTFFHLSLRLRSFEGRRLPRTTEFDLILSHALNEFLLKLTVMVLCFGYLWFSGVPDAAPVNVLRCLEAMVLFIFLGVGVGLIHGVIAAFIRVWNYIFGLFFRGMLIFAGIIWVLDWMPKPLREVAVYIPLSHAVTLFRAGYYEDYPTSTLDTGYAFAWAFGTIALGVLLRSYTKPWRPTE
jgi:capsular polysaccharide transport system permease protein